jgi:hypothetical protein
MKIFSTLSAVLMFVSISAMQAGVKAPAVESHPTASYNDGGIIGCECPCGCPNSISKMLRNLYL